MSVIININTPDIYYFNETNAFTNINTNISSYNDMIIVVHTLYNMNDQLIILCNFSISLAIKCIESNDRFDYNYYITTKQQYDKYNAISTVMWGSFYGSLYTVPSNITYKMLKMLFDYANNTTFRLLQNGDSKLVECNDDELIDFNKKIVIMKSYENNESSNI